MSEESAEDEKKIIGVLNNAHDKGKVCLTRPEIEKTTKLSRTRVKAALASLTAKRVVVSEDHTVTALYYLKKRVTLVKEES